MSEALNVTKAAFGGLREVTTAPLWQYDYGQILEITGLDLPQDNAHLRFLHGCPFRKRMR